MKSDDKLSISVGELRRIVDTGFNQMWTKQQVDAYHWTITKVKKNIESYIEEYGGKNG